MILTGFPLASRICKGIAWSLTTVLSIEWRAVFVLLRSRAGVAIRVQLFGFQAHVAKLSKVLIKSRDW